MFCNRRSVYTEAQCFIEDHGKHDFFLQEICPTKHLLGLDLMVSPMPALSWSVAYARNARMFGIIRCIKGPNL